MTTTWQQSIQSLRQFARRAQNARCELCAQDIREDHQHLLDPATRRVLCGCDGCCLLFDSAGRTKYRRIPRDAKRLGDFQLAESQWEQLLIPISLGFLYRSSTSDQTIACYPSPAGIVETTIDETTWQALFTGKNPAAG